jgi:hypothetical protein
MKTRVLTSVVIGLGTIALVWGTAVADPGNGHGPPPGKGPNRTPVANQGGGNSNNGGQSKGACVSACQSDNRDCTKGASSDRKTCYTQTCASQRAAVQACRGGFGDGVTDQGFGDGVTDQNGNCDTAAQDLKQCLKDCRANFNATRSGCRQSAKFCKGGCGLPFPTPTPTEIPSP